MIDARTAWRAAYRVHRMAPVDARGAGPWVIAGAALGVDDHCPRFGPKWHRLFHIAESLKRAIEPPPPHGRYEAQRDILNRFGRLNPWRAPSMDSPRFRGWMRDSARARDLRDRLLARGLVSLEPGNYVTGLAA